MITSWHRSLLRRAGQSPFFVETKTKKDENRRLAMMVVHLQYRR